MIELSPVRLQNVEGALDSFQFKVPAGIKAWL